MELPPSGVMMIKQYRFGLVEFWSYLQPAAEEDKKTEVWFGLKIHEAASILFS